MRHISLLSMTGMILSLSSCGTGSHKTLTEVTYFTANSKFSGGNGGETTLDPSRPFCETIYTGFLNDDGSGAAKADCVQRDGTVGYNVYDYALQLNTDELKKLRSCVSDNPLDDVPDKVDCSLGLCSEDQGILSLTVNINDRSRSFDIDLNLQNGLPESIKGLFNCLLDAGMFRASPF